MQRGIRVWGPRRASTDVLQGAAFSTSSKSQRWCPRPELDVCSRATPSAAPLQVLHIPLRSRYTSYGLTAPLLVCLRPPAFFGRHCPTCFHQCHINNVRHHRCAPLMPAGGASVTLVVVRKVERWTLGLALLTWSPAKHRRKKRRAKLPQPQPLGFTAGFPKSLGKVVPAGGGKSATLTSATTTTEHRKPARDPSSSALWSLPTEAVKITPAATEALGPLLTSGMVTPPKGARRATALQEGRRLR